MICCLLHVQVLYVLFFLPLFVCPLTDDERICSQYIVNRLSCMSGRYSMIPFINLRRRVVLNFSGPGDYRSDQDQDQDMLTLY